MNDKTFKDYIQNQYYDLIFSRLKSFIINNRSNIITYSRRIPDPTYFELYDFHIMGVTFLNNDDDTRLFFKASVQSDILIKGWNNKSFEEDLVTNQWFSISFSSILNKGLYNVKIDNIDFYSKDRYNHEDVLTKHLIPYIKSKDLDQKAKRFLNKFCPEALIRPMSIPIEILINRMGLNIYKAPLPNNIFGQIFFDENTVNIIDDNGDVIDKHIDSGTILVNENATFMTSIGTTNNTIIHECVHWFLHHRYFELQRIINPEYDHLSCEVIEDFNTLNNSEEEEMAWMEWQANSIAPKILIPYETGKQKLEEILYTIGTENPNDRTATVMEKAIVEFAQFFNVSTTAAKIRAIELGFSKAIGTFNFVDGKRIPPFNFSNIELSKNQTFLIDVKNVLILSTFNDVLRDDLINRRFIHVQGFLVINNEKYVTIEDGKEAKLTNYALNHIDECCYVFTRQTKVNKNYDDSYYRICYLCRDIDSKSFIEAKFDPREGNNENVQKNAIELQKISKEIGRVSNIVNNLPNSFCGTLDAHIKRKKYTNEDVEGLTNISEKTIRNYRNNNNANPGIRSVMALCIGLNLHPTFAFDLIKKAGYDITSRNTEENITYCYLIYNHHMESIDKWNMVLENFGMKRLP